MTIFRQAGRHAQATRRSLVVCLLAAVLCLPTIALPSVSTSSLASAMSTPPVHLTRAPSDDNPNPTPTPSLPPGTTQTPVPVVTLAPLPTPLVQPTPTAVATNSVGTLLPLQPISSLSALPETVTSSSGETQVYIRPAVLRTGQSLFMRVTTHPWAFIVVQLTYPDQQTRVRTLHASRTGVASAWIPIVYRPVDRFARAQLGVTATLPRIGFSDEVEAAITIMAPPQPERITLDIAPRVVRLGQPLFVTVHASANAQASVTLVYPDNEVYALAGFCNANGVYTARIPISYLLKARRASLLVKVLVQTNTGGLRQLQQRIELVP